MSSDRCMVKKCSGSMHSFIGPSEDEQQRLALAVCRQTDYTVAKAMDRLEHNEWDTTVTIREYLNPSYVKRETLRDRRKSTNQRIYGEIGRLMEYRNRNDENRQANSAASQSTQVFSLQIQAEQDQVGQDQSLQDQAEQDQVGQDQAEQDQAEQDQVGQDHAEQDQVRQDQAEQDRILETVTL